MDRRGFPVDLSGDRWELNEPTTKIVLDWTTLAIRNAEIETGFKRYFSWLITTQSPVSVRNAFHFLPIFTRTAAFRSAEDASTVIPYLAFSQARAALSKADRWKLHYARQLYRWCEAQGYSNEDLTSAVDLALGGTVLDIGDTALDAMLTGVGGVGIFAILSGVRSASEKYKETGDPLESLAKGLSSATVHTMRTTVNMAEMATKGVVGVATSRPMRFAGGLITLMANKGAAKFDRWLEDEKPPEPIKSSRMLSQKTLGDSR